MDSRQISFGVGKEVEGVETLLHEFQTLDEAIIYQNSVVSDNTDTEIDRFFIAVIFKGGDAADAEPDEVQMFSAIDVNT